VHSINGIRNRYGGAARARPADPEFYPLLEKLKRIQASGAIGLRVQKTGEKEATLMTFRGKVDDAIQEDIFGVRKIMGLDPKAQEFTVAYASVAKNDRELAILSRSILEIIVDLASYIDVPSVHVEEKRVNPTHVEEGSPESSLRPLMRIHSFDGALHRALCRLVVAGHPHSHPRPPALRAKGRTCQRDSNESHRAHASDVHHTHDVSFC
jgi:hypothetical protein